MRYLSPTSGPHALASGIGRKSPRTIWHWRPVGLWTGAPQDWGKWRPHSWKAHRLSCALGPREKKSLHRNPGWTWLQFLEEHLGKQGVNVAHCRGRRLEAKISGIFISMHFSGGGHFGKIWPTHHYWEALGEMIIQVWSQPHPSVTGCLKTSSGIQPPPILPRDKAPPIRGIGLSPISQWAGTSPSHQEAYSKPPYQLQPQGGQTPEVREATTLLSAKRRPHQKPIKKWKDREL